MSKKNKPTPGQPTHPKRSDLISQKTNSDWSAIFDDFFQKRENIIILILFCIALVIRLYRLRYLNFWVDEFVHVYRAKDFLADFKFSHIFGGEKNGMLVTILNVVGFALFGKNEFGGRFFVAVISAGLIPATYYFCKKIFNTYIGLMTCLFIIFSQFLVFWGRIDRQYGPIPTFYLLLILGVVSFLQFKDDQVKNTFWARYDLNKKWLTWTILFLFLSILTNLETYFIIFSSGLYAIYLWIEQGVTSKKWFVQSGLKLAIVSVLSMAFFILTFTPLNRIIMRPLFLHFMPETMVSLIIPDWGYVKSQLMSVDKFKYFNVYWNLLTTDLPYTIYFFFAGLIALAVLEIKKFMMIFSYYIFPFLLMSFVFLDPCISRYHAFIYPLYLIVVASSFFYVPVLIKKVIPKWTANNSRIWFLSVPGFIILFVISKAVNNSIRLITLEKQGMVIDKKLSDWSFTNWKGPSIYVKQHLNPLDLIFSTMPAGVDFYLDPNMKNTVYTFRQRKLNPEAKSFIPIGNSTSLPSASSYDDFFKTLQRNQRIWLISDYYLYNIMTEDQCRALVFQNFNLIPEASKDGSTQLFLWDPFQPKKFEHNCIWELGKPSGFAGTPDLSIVGQSNSMANGVMLTFQSVGIDSDGEAAVQFKNETYYIPKPKTFTPEGLGISEVRIPGNKLIAGNNNNFRIVYFQRKIDPYKGFIIYNLDVK